MRRRILRVAVVALGLLAVATVGESDVEAGARWRFKFDAGTFANVVTKATKGGKAQYYLSYKVTNSSTDARKPRIRIELHTDTKKVYRDRYDARVFKKVAKAAGKKSISSTFGLRKSDLGAGASAEGLACFGPIDPHADKLTVRIYGLWDPVFRDKKGRTFSERRVLVLTFDRPGDEYRRSEDKITYKGSKEEVEGEPTLLPDPRKKDES